MIWHVARYQWMRVRRWWMLLASIMVSAAVGLIPLFLSDNITGIDIIGEERKFLPFVMLAVMVSSALAISREADEGSADMLWALPVDNASLILGKFIGVIPMAALAFLGFWTAAGTGIALRWMDSGLSLWYLLGELGLTALWWGAGILSAAVLGGFFGLLLRGFWLYLVIIALWFGTVIGIIWVTSRMMYTGNYNGATPFWQLMDWTTFELVFTVSIPRDLYALKPYLGGLIWQRLFYIILAATVALLSVRLIRGYRTIGQSMVKLVASIALALALTIASAGIYFHEQGHGFRRFEQELAYYRQHYGWYYNDNSPTDDAVPMPQPEGIVNPPLYIDSYELDLDITKPPVLKVKAVFSLRNTSDKTIDQPMLTLRHNFDVLSAAADGQKLRVSRQGDGIYLKELRLEPGEDVSITMEYCGPVEGWDISYANARLTDFVTKSGFMLSADYGWYPLTMPIPLEYVYPDGTMISWGTAYSSSQILAPSYIFEQIRERGLDPAAVTGKIDPWSRQAYFSVTVHKNGRYPVIGSVGQPASPGAGDVRIAGKGHYLTLLGWPLEAKSVGDDVVYRPFEYDGDDGIYPVTVMRDTWRWLGIGGQTAKAVIAPFQIQNQSVVDGEEGWYVGIFEPIGYMPDFFDGVLTGRRMPSVAEIRLQQVYQAWRQWKYNGSYSDDPYRYGYFGGFEDIYGIEKTDISGPDDPDVPSIKDIMDWIKAHDEKTVQDTMHGLYIKAQQRPLSIADLKEAFGL